MTSYYEIRFDISREGLCQLEQILEPLRVASKLTGELENFVNEVRNTLQREPISAPVLYAPVQMSWLDE